MSTENNTNEQNVVKRRGPDPRFVWGIVAVVIFGGLLYGSYVKYKELSAELEKTQAKLAQVTQKYKTLESTKSKLEHSIKEYEDEVKKLTEEISTLENEISTLKSFPGARRVYHVNYDKNDKSKTVIFVFRWCPAGTFTMGSPESEYKEFITGELADLYDEKQHQVKLTKGFWMMETEVTQEQWQAVMGDNPSQHTDEKNLPVENVSFNDCLKFCQKCAQLGLPVQLPTEAQWEYACRAGADGKPTTGSIETVAWCGGAKSENKTHGVGQKCPNAWGLYDMYGNVWEFCTDWIDYYPSEPQVDPPGPPTRPSTDAHRVLRGLDWTHEETNYRATTRGFNRGDDDHGQPFFGFRCVIVP